MANRTPRSREVREKIREGMRRYWKTVTEEARKELGKHNSEKMKALYKSERLRIRWGLEQKSRLMFIKPENKTKTQFRYRLRKRGYIVDTERRQAFYTKDTDRSPTMEKNAAIKHHFIVLPMKEVKGVGSEE